MSKKIKNGKFVERTAEEQVELDRLKAEYYANVGTWNSKSKRPKSEEHFAKITDSQFEKLMHIESGASVKIFIVLAYQSFKHWGKPFQMLTDNFAKNGFSRATLKRALVQLERAGLILVERKHRHLPVLVASS
jgi:hypothetical protein